MDIAKQIEPIRAKVKTEAKKVVEIMAKEYDIEDQYAKAALETAVEVMRCPGDNRERVAAADLSWISPSKSQHLRARLRLAKLKTSSAV